MRLGVGGCGRVEENNGTAEGLQGGNYLSLERSGGVNPIAVLHRRVATGQWLCWDPPGPFLTAQALRRTASIVPAAPSYCT